MKFLIPHQPNDSKSKIRLPKLMYYLAAEHYRTSLAMAAKSLALHLRGFSHRQGSADYRPSLAVCQLAGIDPKPSFASRKTLPARAPSDRGPLTTRRGSSSVRLDLRRSGALENLSVNSCEN